MFFFLSVVKALKDRNGPISANQGAMLFAPFKCTHPPLPVPPYLLTQNLSSKDIAGSDIMKLKVSRCHSSHWAGKG